jgi:cell division protein FtsI (penicillin-binding protein 3)
MKMNEKKWIRFRIYCVAAMLLSGLTIVLGRVYQLQVLQRERLGALARAGYRGVVKLPPKRGTIYDRDGRELAISIQVGSVYAHPHQVKDKRKTAQSLSRLLGESEKMFLGQLESERPFVWLKRRIDPESAKGVEAMAIEGLGVTSETRRFYPGKETAAHLVGFVGSDNEGLEGLEREYDALLRGPQDSLIQMRDALGRSFSVTRPIPYAKGLHDLILTINKAIQYRAEKVLKAAMEKTAARSGQCLVLDPATGEILAWAVAPGFNPNVFWKYGPEVWRNRIVTDWFEPGSTIKAFLLAAALEEGTVRPSKLYDCEQGSYEFGGKTLHDTHKYGLLSVSEIITKSSNIGAVKIGQSLGYETFCRYLKRFGFGTATGIDVPGERAGFIRSGKKVRPIEQATMFFGQGITVTSLQLAMAMAAIANGGNLMKPQLVKAVVDHAGRSVQKNEPEVLHRVISESTARQVATILEGVVGEDGTAPEAAIPGFRVAGKTGTGQKVDPATKTYSRTKFTASFVGFVPADGPMLVILAVLDEPRKGHYGGIVAAPVFREVGSWSLNAIKVNPNTAMVEQNERPGASSEAGRALSDEQGGAMRELQLSLRAEAGILPDFRGLTMREVVTEVRSLGLDMILEGTGLAFQQDPRAGVPLKGVASVKVSFRPPS